MNWDDDKLSYNQKSKNHPDLFSTLNEDEKKLMEIIRSSGQVGIDALASTAGIPVSKVSATLLNLEFSGFLRTLPGKVYELT